MDRFRPLVLGITTPSNRMRSDSPTGDLGRESMDKKMKVSNKAVHAIGAKARLSMTADVG